LAELEVLKYLPSFPYCLTWMWRAIIAVGLLTFSCKKYIKVFYGIRWFSRSIITWSKIYPEVSNPAIQNCH